MNSLQFLPFKGEFFAIFILLGLFPFRWIFCVLHSLRVNSLEFSPFKGDFFEFLNSLQFLIFKGEFFAMFIPLGLFLSNFHSLRVNSLHFSPVRMNFFQFLPLKGTFFQIFLPWRDWRRRLIDWSIKIALRVFQSLNFPEDVCVSRRPMVT